MAKKSCSRGGTATGCAWRANRIRISTEANRPNCLSRRFRFRRALPAKSLDGHFPQLEFLHLAGDGRGIFLHEHEVLWHFEMGDLPLAIRLKVARFEVQ